ncbi:hypothetical protein DFH09DRAFT_256870 [Mycena vulgaris]|nr:hypothetical protein DFH09DRAFT_256870 [Mycena vulgaris]
MGIQLEVAHEYRPTSHFRWTIQSVVGFFLCLLHALWTRLTRPCAPRIFDSFRRPQLLGDCEKEPGRYADVYQVRPHIFSMTTLPTFDPQSHAQLLASLERRNAADAEFEAQVMALLAPVKKRLAEMARDNGDSVPVAHDSPPTPDLPLAPQMFYGRDHELSALVAMFSDGGQAHAALLGQEGTGKSALALALLHHPAIVGKFGPRRFFVPCAPLDGGADPLGLLASALGFTHTPGKDAVLVALASCPSDTLLVVDDLQPLTALQALLPELAALPRVSLLLTLRGARRPLGPIYTAPYPAPLGPLPLPAARALFRAISDLPAAELPPTAGEADAGADVDAVTIDALLHRAGCLPRPIAQLAQCAQYEPLAFLLARCAEEGGV